MKQSLISLLLIFYSMAFSHAAHKCPEDKDCFHVGALSLDPISKSLRKTLNEYTRFIDQESATVDNFGIRPYLPFFHEKFIVLRIQDGDFGGYWIHIFLSPKRMIPLLIWIYEVDENEFLIRSLEKIPLNKGELKSWESLRSKKYIRYWL